MPDVYRAVFEGEEITPSKVQQWLENAYPKDISASTHTSVADQGVLGERWTSAWGDGRDRLDVSFLAGHRILLVIERQWPSGSVGDATHWPPAQLAELLAATGSHIGPFRTGADVTSEDVVEWLDDPLGSDAQVVLLVSERDDGAPLLWQRMMTELSGLAVLGRARVPAAEAILERGRLQSNQVRDGCLLHLSRLAGSIEVDVIPSTVVSMRPQEAVRRIERRCARKLADYQFTPAEARLLLELSRQQLQGQSADAELLLNDLLGLEEQVRQLRDERDTSLLEHDETLAALNELRNKVRWLELRLRDVGEYGITVVEDEIPAPDSCADAERLARELLPNLTIGDLSGGIGQLDAYEKAPVWAKKIWLGLRALDDYAAAKREGRHIGNFMSYCTDPPTAGIPYFAQSVALSESESTESDPITRAARTFSVPSIVDASCRQYMGAHLKIDAKGSPAPRLHYFDDTGAGCSERVYVGYIGPHLPTAG